MGSVVCGMLLRAQGVIGWSAPFIEASEQLPGEVAKVRVAVTDRLLMRTDGAVGRLQQEHGAVRLLRHRHERAVVLQVPQTVRVLSLRHGRWIASRHGFGVLRRNPVDPPAIRLDGSGQADGMRCESSSGRPPLSAGCPRAQPGLRRRRSCAAPRLPAFLYSSRLRCFVSLLRYRIRRCKLVQRGASSRGGTHDQSDNPMQNASARFRRRTSRTSNSPIRALIRSRRTVTGLSAMI